MRVFVTGATGFIGSAIVQELIGAGHQVIGLARSDSAAKSLAATGAKVHRGDLENLQSLRKGSAMSDGVIHTGFIHDFSKFKASCETDRNAIEALGSALVGSDRPLIITSGIGLLPAGRLVTEESRPPSPSPYPRVASEEAASAVADRASHACVLRHQSMAMAITALCRFLSIWRVKEELLHTWVKGSTYGQQCTDLMLPNCSGLLWKKGLQELTITV